MRILHVLHTSTPNASGYAIRSNYIIECQKKMGLESEVVTSSQQVDSESALELIHGRRYWRTPKQPDRRIGAREIMMMHALKKTVNKAIVAYKPDIVHAASPVLVGLPAMYAAKRNNIPFVYEVRDLWENASVDRGKWKYDTLPYKGAKGLESILYRKADGIVTICEALRNEIAPRIGKGITLSVIKNGVESSHFTPRPPCQEVIKRWNLGGKSLIGYIGAFQPYEGLETLILAMPQIQKEIPNAHLMITGGGNALEKQLRAMTVNEGLSELITFTGRVPHNEVQDMYSVVDLMVYPRISTRTTELTTPLKPLEAMALKIPVALSNTKAMMEIVSPGKTGFSFKAGDSSDLARTCIDALGDKEQCLAMTSAARKYVEEERHWPSIVEGYRDIYEAAKLKQNA